MVEATMVEATGVVMYVNPRLFKLTRMLTELFRVTEAAMGATVRGYKTSYILSQARQSRAEHDSSHLARLGDTTVFLLCCYLNLDPNSGKAITDSWAWLWQRHS